MSEGMQVHHAHHEDAIEHLEDEIRSLEGVTRWGRPLRIGVFILASAAIFAAGVWWIMSPPPITSGGAKYVTSTDTPIEVLEPRGIRLADPPSRFAWESVSGRLQYVVRIYVKGTNTPVLERMVTSPAIDLTPDEQARMPRGKAYVWTVAAQGKNGATIASGQSTFKIR